jgi:hypothetical chaperone protein
MRCGIDFGTSNTTMAVADKGGSRLVPLEGDKLTIPTAIFFTHKNKKILFGREAVEAYLSGQEGRFMRSLKRVLGTSLMDQPVIVNGARTTFPIIIGRFLKHIRETAEKNLGTELTEVTMGRPVHFQDDNPTADQRAQEQLADIAASVGFKNIDFQYEPIAAALAHEKEVTGEKLALVVDIGGGTSDFSVIRLSRDYARTRNRAQDILVNNGVRIGGNDCDKTINLETAMPLLGMGSLFSAKKLEIPRLIYYELSEWVKVNWNYTPQNINWVKQMISQSYEPEKLMLLERVLEDQLGHKILNVSEEIKIELSQQKTATGDFSFLDHGLDVTMTQEHMNESLEKVLAPVHDMMLDTVRMADIQMSDIAIIVLTGGSTGLPVFQEWIATHFPKATILQDDKLGSVGLGLVL